MDRKCPVDTEERKKEIKINKQKERNKDIAREGERKHASPFLFFLNAC